MTEMEQDKYAELLISMCTDFLMRKTSWENMISALKMAIKLMEKL